MISNTGASYFMNFLRCTRHDKQEDKSQLRSELEQQIAEFTRKGGAVTEVPFGVTALDDGGIRLGPDGLPVSGFPGIMWHAATHRWQVYAGKKKDRPVGYADDIASALRMQKQFKNQSRKMKRGGNHVR